MLDKTASSIPLDGGRFEMKLLVKSFEIFRWNFSNVLNADCIWSSKWCKHSILWLLPLITTLTCVVAMFTCNLRVWNFWGAFGCRSVIVNAHATKWLHYLFHTKTKHIKCTFVMMCPLYLAGQKGFGQNRTCLERGWAEARIANMENQEIQGRSKHICAWYLSVLF